MKLYVKVKKQDGGKEYHPVDSVLYGVEDTAREVVKAYVGVAGKARQCFSAYEEITYYGNSTDGAIQPFPIKRSNEPSAATLGNYAMFLGSPRVLSSDSEFFDIYDQDLSHTSIPVFPQLAAPGPAASTQDYAVFFMGAQILYYLDLNLVLRYKSLYNHPGHTAVRFQDGILYTAARSYDYVYRITKDLVNEQVGLMRRGSYDAPESAAATKDFAIFCIGGEMIRVGSDDIIQARLNAYKAGKSTRVASVKNYVIMAGGLASNFKDPLDNAAAIDKNGTIFQLSPLSQKRERPTPLSAGSYAIFAGGEWTADGKKQYSAAVDLYDKNLVHTVGHDLCVPRSEISAAVAGEWILFGGGIKANNNTGDVDTIDVFRLGSRE